MVSSIRFSAINREHIGVTIEFKQTIPILRIFDVGKAKEFYYGNRLFGLFKFAILMSLTHPYQPISRQK